jgi:hypothetical protein
MVPTKVALISELPEFKSVINYDNCDGIGKCINILEGWIARFRFLAEARDLSLLHSVWG